MGISETQAVFIWIAIGTLAVAWGILVFPLVAGVVAAMLDGWFPEPAHPLPRVTVHHDPEFGTVALTARLPRSAESLLRNEFNEHRLNIYIHKVRLSRCALFGQRPIKEGTLIHFDPKTNEAHLMEILRACKFPVFVKQCES